MTELKIIPPVILHILPFLTAAVRLRLAQAGSSALRQLILGEPYEKEAFMEYLRMSMLMSVFDTLGKPPFKLHILHEWNSAGSDLKKIRRKRLLNGLQTWHAVCARVSFYLRPAIDEKWNGTQSNFEDLGTKGCIRMYTYSGLKEVLTSPGRSDAAKLLFLLKFGLDESMVVRLPPLEFLDTEDGSVMQKYRLGLRDSQEAIRIEEGISVREFFSWNYARKSCAPGDTKSVVQPERWGKDLCREYFLNKLWSLGFKPQLDSTHLDDDDDDAKVVMSGDGFVYGNKKVSAPFSLILLC